MAVSIEAAFVLIDKASDPLKKIAAQAKITDAALKGMGGGTAGKSGFSGLTTDTNSFADALKKMRGEASNMGRDVEQAGKKAEKSLGFFKRTKNDIENWTRSLLQAHPAIINVTSGLAGMGGALKGAVTALPLMATAALTAAPAIVALAGAVGGLATSLIGAVGGAAMIGGGLIGSFVVGLGSVAAIAKPAITSLTNYRAAVTKLNTAMASGNPAQIKKAQQEVDKLAKQTPGVAGLNRELTGFTDQWKKATKSGQADFFKLAADAIAEVRKQLGWLGAEADKDMKAVKDAFEKNLLPFIGGQQFKGMVQGLGGIFRANMPGLGAGVVNILKGLANILKIIAPDLSKVGSGFDHLTGSFEKWTSASGRGGQGSIKEMTKAFKEWMRLLGEVVKLIAQVTGAGMKTGTDTITKWADYLTKVTDKLSKPGGTKGMEDWFKRTMDQAGQLWPLLKNVAGSLVILYKGWEPLSKVLQKVLTAIPAPVLTGILAAYVGGKALAGGISAAKTVGGALGKWTGQRDGSPERPLVVQVAGGFGGGGGTGLGGGMNSAEEKVGLRARFASTSFGSKIAATGIGGKLLGTTAKDVGEELAVAGGAAAAPGFLGKMGGLLKGHFGIGGAVAAGDEGAGLLSRLFTGGGIKGFGGLTGGFSGMAAMAAMPLLTRLLPKKLLESGLGKTVGSIGGGFLSGGLTGGAIMGLNALLPKSITRSGVGKAATSIGMGAATGATIGSVIPGVGTAVGAGVGAGIAGISKMGWNPFSASGRKKFVSDMGTMWGGIKKGAEGAWKGITSAGGTAVNFVKRHLDWAGAIAGPLGLAVTMGIKHFGAITSFLGGLPGKIGGLLSKVPSIVGNVFKGVADTITAPFKSAFNFISGLPGKIGNLFGGIGKGIGGAASSVAKTAGNLVSGGAHAVGSFVSSLNPFQHGGQVPMSSNVLVGEAGPEVLHVPGGSRVYPLTGGFAGPQYAAADGVPTPMSQASLLGVLGTNAIQQLRQVQAGITAVAASLNNPRSGLSAALQGAGDAWDAYAKNATQDLTQNQNQTQQFLDWLNKWLPTNTKSATDAATTNFNNLDTAVQTAWQHIVTNTQWGINQIFTKMADAFKTMGVTPPKGIGGSAPAAKKERGGRLPQAETGYRLPGPARGDHIPIMSRGGSVVAMADGGELVVNRHTEGRINSMLGGRTTLGKEVAGETRPHAASTGWRIPGFQTGGVVGQIDSLASAAGFNKIAIAGILGNAQQESSMNPNTPGGGLWQQISNFGQGTGGSVQAQWARMLPQIQSIKGAMNAAGSPGAAADIFERAFERAGIPALANREKYAQMAYAGQLGGPITGGTGAGGGGIGAIIAPTIVAPNLGGAGAIGALAQGAMSTITAGANKKLQAAAAAMAPMIGGGGGPGPSFTQPSGPVPPQVQYALQAANQLAARHPPYGHQGAGWGLGAYDCSSYVSTVMDAAGIWPKWVYYTAAQPINAHTDPGPGQYITIGTWGTSGQQAHTMMSIMGNYFESGGNDGGPHKDSGWSQKFDQYRHPHGFATGGIIGKDPAESRRRLFKNVSPGVGRPGYQPTQAEAEQIQRHQAAIQAQFKQEHGRALGGYIPVPWFANGGDFIAKRPTIIGVGDTPGGERVQVTPTGGGGGAGNNRPIHIEIHKIENHRKGDIQKIVDEELQALASTITGRL